MTVNDGKNNISVLLRSARWIALPRELKNMTTFYSSAARTSVDSFLRYYKKTPYDDSELKTH